MRIVPSVLRPKSVHQALQGGSLGILIIVLALFGIAAWLLHPQGPLGSFWRARQHGTRSVPGPSPIAQPAVVAKSRVPIPVNMQERMEEDGEYSVKVVSRVPSQANAGSMTVYFSVEQGGTRWERRVTVQTAAGNPVDAAAEFAEPKLFGGAARVEAYLEP